MYVNWALWFCCYIRIMCFLAVCISARYGRKYWPQRSVLRRMSYQVRKRQTKKHPICTKQLSQANYSMSCQVWQAFAYFVQDLSQIRHPACTVGSDVHSSRVSAVCNVQHARVNFSAAAHTTHRHPAVLPVILVLLGCILLNTTTALG